MNAAQAVAMKQKLIAVGLPFEDIAVFGAIRCNVHVKCLGSETASKWAAVLAQVFSGAKVRSVKTVWDAAVNHSTCLLPTKRSGFLITVAA